MTLLWAVMGCSSRSVAPAPNSPAIGTWKKGGLRYVLNADGTGLEQMGRTTSPLSWAEQNGTVTLNVQEGKLQLTHIGKLSSNGRTLTVTQTGGKTSAFTSTSSRVNWPLQKQ
jgi:phage terminase large subunit-like protein